MCSCDFVSERFFYQTTATVIAIIWKHVCITERQALFYSFPWINLLCPQKHPEGWVAFLLSQERTLDGPSNVMLEDDVASGALGKVLCFGIFLSVH